MQSVCSSVCHCSCMGICQQFWLWLVHIIISIQTHNLALVLIVLGSLVLLLGELWSTIETLNHLIHFLP
jgi:hypothetical protein